MYAQVDKSKGNKSRAVAHSVTQEKSAERQGPGFVDNREATKAQTSVQLQMRHEGKSSQDVIQRVGNYAPITIHQVTPTRIAELEYGIGKAIKFTGISSCIGVIGKRGKVLVAVHLPLVDRLGVSVSTVDPTQLGTAVGGIMAGCASVYIVGEKTVWLGSGASAQYGAVKAEVNGTDFPMGSGSYAAFLDDGDGRNQILLYFNDEQIWPVEF